MSKSSSFRTRAFRAGGYSFVAVLFLLVILVAVNVAMNALPTTATRLDATAQQLTTLSDQTKNVLGILDRDVTFTWICQEGMEDPIVEELMNRYVDSSSGFIKIEKLDPNVNPGIFEQYTDEYYDNSVLVTSGERTRYVSFADMYVMDMNVYYSTGEEHMDFQGEDALTRALYFVATDDVPAVYYITGHGEQAFSEEAKNTFLDENIELKQLNLTVEGKLKDDTDMLICYLPQDDISETEKGIITDYMNRGGRFLLVTGLIDKHLPNLESIMGAYGITAAEGMVVEGNSRNYSQYSCYLLPTPQKHAITDPVIKEQMNVLIPMARGLQITNTGSTTTIVTDLMKTTDQSYSKVDYSGSLDQTATDPMGPFSLGVAVEDVVLGTKAVWFSSDYMLDPNCGGADDLFFNAVNWMCEQEEMISIRGKSLNQQYLNMDDQAVSTMTWLVVAIIPGIFLGLGIALYQWRKKR